MVIAQISMAELKSEKEHARSISSNCLITDVTGSYEHFMG